MRNIVPPHLVPADLMTFAENNVKKALAVGASKLNIHIPFEGVTFFKKSTTAGYVMPLSSNLVYLNLDLVKRNRQHFEKDTIPHEVAHLIASKLQVKNNLAPEGHHGKTWKMVMRRVYGLEPTRCHQMDTSGIGRNVKKYKYICNCTKYVIGQVRHNKIQKGSKYSCLKCKKHLVFLNECD